MTDTHATGSASFVLRPLRKQPSLGVIALIGLLFSNCLGSGYGFEQAVQGAGPLLTILICVILPIFWTFPTGLAVSELASHLPSNAGTVAWIHETHHPIVSYYNIWTTLFINIATNASYVALATNYFERFFVPSPNHMEEWARALTKVVVVVLASTLNVIGVEVVGFASVVMSCITLTPFVLLTIVGFAKFPLDNAALQYVPPSVNWPEFLSFATWNFGSIDNMGSMIEDIIDPQRTLIYALVPLCAFGYALAYLLPVMAGVIAMSHETGQPGGDYTEWKSGYWTHVALVAGGTWLRWIMLFGAVVSGAGYIVTMLCASSRQLQAFGVLRLFPDKVSRVLAYSHPRLGTPIVAIALNAGIALLLCLATSFSVLVSVQQVLYCLRLCLVYMALVRRRFYSMDEYAAVATGIADERVVVPEDKPVERSQISLPQVSLHEPQATSTVAASANVIVDAGSAGQDEPEVPQATPASPAVVAPGVTSRYRIPLSSPWAVAALLTPAFIISALTAFLSIQLTNVVLTGALIAMAVSWVLAVLSWKLFAPAPSTLSATQ